MYYNLCSTVTFFLQTGSGQVMTMSFHHVSKGFFPGAGQCSETGAGNGRDYNLNIPLKEGEA